MEHSPVRNAAHLRLVSQNAEEGKMTAAAKLSFEETDTQCFILPVLAGVSLIFRYVLCASADRIF
ncbi:hypothetical protein BC939DRAFT_454262 [Gamsiella multidivaricata]|uniref:uncharacterized protein n=1 Tax=Gamsiella multidivaricata TaxID=101098 RepID=UPI00221EBDAA|nr:uncharacterized protein BC939DRAFT_454262 [Gamsiella multidivaricata]KAI7822205.1 hypothetical protein BC939DRAFT_454262 [Gamsiella multidivaricata]